MARTPPTESSLRRSLQRRKRKWRKLSSGWRGEGFVNPCRPCAAARGPGAAPRRTWRRGEAGRKEMKNARVLAGIPLRLRISAVACMGGLSHSVRTQTRQSRSTWFRHVILGSIAKPTWPMASSRAMPMLFTTTLPATSVKRCCERLRRLDPILSLLLGQDAVVLEEFVHGEWVPALREVIRASVHATCHSRDATVSKP